MQHKVISWSCKLIKSKVLHLTSETAQHHTSLDVILQEREILVGHLVL